MCRLLPPTSVVFSQMALLRNLSLRDPTPLTTLNVLLSPFKSPRCRQTHSVLVIPVLLTSEGSGAGVRQTATPTTPGPVVTTHFPRSLLTWQVPPTPDDPPSRVPDWVVVCQCVSVPLVE